MEAQYKRIVVGGYRVTTENYGTYVPPVVEARPGDTVAAHLTNNLQKPVVQSDHVMPGDPQDDPEENPTNLHYFHGGIVTPNNSRPMDAGLGNGDNIYVYRKRGETFDFSVPIPDDLESSVLEGAGPTPHPSGLNWYHSHLHGISSTQVMGGLSGLLSVGDALANVKAACQEEAADNTKCKNSVFDDTEKLKDRTDPKYILLRDISLRDATVPPTKADGTATATWAPDETGSSRDDPCGIPDQEGYCQRKGKGRFWLFTLNGQRFPKITIRRDRNALLRMGNLSANVGYWLELECNEGCEQLPADYLLRKSDQPNRMYVKLEVLSLDEVVPAKFARPDEADRPKANTFLVSDFLLMPASRVELYVRNDFRHDRRISFILRSKQLQAGTQPGSDIWPEIQLARIVLEPSVLQSEVVLALNAPVASGLFRVFSAQFTSFVESPTPPGCVRDLQPQTDLAKREHRRISFMGQSGPPQEWRILTEIVHFPEAETAILAGAPKCKGADGKERTCVDEKDFSADESLTIGNDPEAGRIGVPFEAYDNGDGSIDWLGEKSWGAKPLNHPCIYLDDTGRSHKQLWRSSTRQQNCIIFIFIR